jgi:hypothetical protein
MLMVRQETFLRLDEEQLERFLRLQQLDALHHLLRLHLHQY